VADFFRERCRQSFAGRITRTDSTAQRLQGQNVGGRNRATAQDFPFANALPVAPVHDLFCSHLYRMASSLRIERTVEARYMIRIVATADQVRQLQQATDGIELVDENGKRLGIVARDVDLEDIRIARERLKSDQPRLSYAEVLDHIQGLEAS
jgi:hypothetical protein